MERRKKVYLVVGGAAGCLFFVLIAATLLGYLGIRAWSSLERKQYNHADTFIKQYIPKAAKLVVRHDDHGGVHGDGTLWEVYELSGQAKKDFKTKTREDANWNPLPLPEELTRLPGGLLHDDFPSELTEGSYFFYDFQPEWYPEYDTNEKPVWDRPSFNFIIMIYDSKNEKIYVDNEDT